MGHLFVLAIYLVMTKKHTEEEIASRVVYFLKEMKWEVYQEVDAGCRADIVGTRDHVCCIVEVKTTLSTDLCAQVMEWRRRRAANYIYIAVPRPKLPTGFRSQYSRGKLFLYEILEEKGIGILEVKSDFWGGEEHWEVVERSGAKLIRKLAMDIREKLHEEQKVFARAGNAINKHWTPWKGTCMAWAGYVNEHPGCTIKECIDIAGHHYSTDSTARSSMLTWIKEGKVEGVECRSVKVGKREQWLLYPKEAK